MTVHAYTSFSYNYIDRARVWAESLRRIHPEWAIWAVVTDREPPGFVFDTRSEPFDCLLTVEQLFGTETESWLFGLNVIEACTGVKARALLHILEQKDTEYVFYFDPDTVVFNTMTAVIDILKDYCIVLTPHQIEPEPYTNPTAIQDNEIGSLKWGIFNLGFIAVNRSGESLRFAKWWAERLQNWCHDRIEKGLFVDQKWCNLVPCLFSSVHILRDPGYNVASWNLSHREITTSEDGTILVNGVPLRFFHFSKLGLTGDTMTSRYAKNNIQVFELWSAYKRWIASNAEPTIPVGYWYYNSYSDGTEINQSDKLRYRDDNLLRVQFPKPFSNKPSF